MKKMINYAFVYAIVAMVGGVFYREFTKFNNFYGVTSLGKIHVHLFVLGMVFFLVLALFCNAIKVDETKNFNKAILIYNIGLIWMIVMLVVRGVSEVMLFELSNDVSAAISGLSGLGHIIIAVGLIWVLLKLKEATKKLA